MTTAPLKTFLIYAHEDSTAVDLLRKQLVSLEKSKSIELWFDGKILAGQKWDETIKHRLEQAELVLLCVSVDFINSDYIEDTELKKALQRHRDGLAHLVPIVLRPCDWVEYFQIGQLQALPHKARPVYSSNFPHPDEAFYEIQQGIKTLVADMLQKRAARQHAEEEAARVAEVEKNRAQRRQQLDDAAWQAARAEMDAADTGQDKIIALETYLDDPSYTRHRDEAEKLLAEIKAAETKRLIAEKKQREAEKQRLLLPEMIFVKGGSFEMGSAEDDKEAYDDGKPRHRVTVADFELGKYPATVAQFAVFVRDSSYRSEAEKSGGSNIWVGSKWEMHAGVRWDCDASGKTRPESDYKHPVLHVSWNDARAYCDWLTNKTGKTCRLPTEAEWEYAARGGEAGAKDEYPYAGSNNLDEVAWHSGNSGGSTHAVGQKKPNRLGLYDMSGNVWEWCEDDFHDDYTEAPFIGRAWLDSSRGSNRVLRGGSWNSKTSRGCRVAHRFYAIASYRTGSRAFRLAASPSGSARERAST